MLTNRLTGLIEEPEEQARAPDYWVVRASCGFFFVSRETAREIVLELRRFWRPGWIRFRDLSGSEIHLRRRTIELVGESSAAQRAFDRRLRRALDAEENQDAHPWEE